MDIKKINEELKIVKLNNACFGTKSLYCKVSGYVFYHSELGYLAFNSNDSFVKTPYRPCGGKNAAESILLAGGFLDYENMCWLRPIALYE